MRELLQSEIHHLVTARGRDAYTLEDFTIIPRDMHRVAPNDLMMVMHIASRNTPRMFYCTREMARDLVDRLQQAEGELAAWELKEIARIEDELEPPSGA